MIRLTAEHAEYAEIYKKVFSALFAISAVRLETDYDF